MTTLRLIQMLVVLKMSLRKVLAKSRVIEWNRVPSDLSHQHDFYLYGTNKR